MSITTTNVMLQLISIYIYIYMRVCVCVCVCVCMYIDHSTAYTIRGIIYVLSILNIVKLVNLKYGIKKHNKILIVGYYDLIEVLN